MYNKLKSNCRVAEAAATSEKLNLAYQNYDLTPDSYLPGTFTSLNTETELLVTAINRSKTESVMDEKNIIRVNKVQALFYFIEGAVYNPDEAVSSAAQQVKQVLDSYGLSEITSKSYDTQSTLISSLLADLAAPSLLASIAAIAGCAAVIAALQAAEDDFVHTYADYEQDKAEEGELESASVVKKRVLDLINDHLVEYLRAMVKVNNALYGGFAATVDQIIDDMNEIVARRSNGKRCLRKTITIFRTHSNHLFQSFGLWKGFFNLNR